MVELLIHLFLLNGLRLLRSQYLVVDGRGCLVVGRCRSGHHLSLKFLPVEILAGNESISALLRLQDSTIPRGRHLDNLALV